MTATTETATKHVIAVGNNGRLTTTFAQLEIGQKCRVMLGGRPEIVTIENTGILYNRK